MHEQHTYFCRFRLTGKWQSRLLDSLDVVAGDGDRQVRVTCVKRVRGVYGVMCRNTVSRIIVFTILRHTLGTWLMHLHRWGHAVMQFCDAL